MTAIDSGSNNGFRFILSPFFCNYVVLSADVVMIPVYEIIAARIVLLMCIVDNHCSILLCKTKRRMLTFSPGGIQSNSTVYAPVSRTTPFP